MTRTRTRTRSGSCVNVDVGRSSESSCVGFRVQQNGSLELKKGGVLEGAREVFGSWLQEGHLHGGRDLLLDRDRKLAEDASGRLMG